MAELHFVQETAVRWEYKFLYLERGYEAEVNRLGRDGWEAISYTGKSVMFKRPLAALIDGSKRPPELSPEERKKRADQRNRGVLNDGQITPNEGGGSVEA